MKNIVAIIVILIALAGGILFYMKGCSSGPSPETTAAIKKADSTQRALDSTKAVDLQVIVRLQLDTAQKNRKIDTLMRQRDALEKDKAARIAVVRQTLANGDTAEIRADTAAIIANWRALSGEVKGGLSILAQSDSVNNKIIMEWMERAHVSDSIASTWERLYHATDTANTLQKKATANLQKDFDWQQFQLKIWKPVAIGAAAYIVLDIVIHSLKK